MIEFRGGRLPPLPEDQAPRLKLGVFLHPDADQLPPTPAVVDWIDRVTDWPVFLNDRIGDCTIAAAGHMVEAWTCYGQGRTVTMTDADVLRAYRDVSGYDPNNPASDRGAVMQNVLRYWRKTGIGGHKILAYAQVNYRSEAEVRAALNLFGHLYVGVNLPASAMDQFNQDVPWDVVGYDGGILGGHAIDLGHDTATNELAVITWGRPQTLTHAWWGRYVEECWVAVSPEWLDVNGHSPAGLDLHGLGEAFAALTGEANPFPDAPTPPGPIPPPPAVDDADRAFAVVLSPWVRMRHTGRDLGVAAAARDWMRTKGLG